MSEPLVVVYTATGRLEANRIQSWLEAEGIPAVVSQEGAGTVYGLSVGVLGEAEILVPAARAAEARALLAEMEAGELDQDSEGPDSALPPAGDPSA